ncbi:MAG: enoyl-CoA hydratase [Betaproteobacteria bacterium]|nr:enoyl-CoA hydratase [Betaproteobacteria bacterium]MBI2959128.1 enoyl-CoA hydratase [Betaproteobacteria bacterium]
MEQVRIEQSDGVLRIELNRPEKKNAITLAMYQALADALGSAQSDARGRVVLVHGQPEAFTAGNDLRDFLANPPRDESHPVFLFLRALRDFDKPIVAAVSGPAVGIGTTMLLHCDLVYAASDARFALPFVNLALCPEAGSSYLLARLAGYPRAAELLLLGEPFSAERALEIGLVNAIVPPAQLLDTAAAMARRLAQKPPDSLRVTKSLMRRALMPGIEQAMAAENLAFRERLGSAEAKEAMSAFLEKRPPQFSKG